MTLECAILVYSRARWRQTLGIGLRGRPVSKRATKEDMIVIPRVYLNH